LPRWNIFIDAKARKAAFRQDPKFHETHQLAAHRDHRCAVNPLVISADKAVARYPSSP
jgi:hypothetical protein